MNLARLGTGLTFQDCWTRHGPPTTSCDLPGLSEELPLPLVVQIPACPACRGADSESPSRRGRLLALWGVWVLRTQGLWSSFITCTHLLLRSMSTWGSRQPEAGPSAQQQPGLLSVLGLKTNLFSCAALWTRVYKGHSSPPEGSGLNNIPKSMSTLKCTRWDFGK